MILRPTYLDATTPFIDKPMIKILTGIRRSGKSVVLRLLKDELLERGIEEEQIINFNFESFAFIELTKAQKLYAFVKDKIKNKHKYYLLLNEIQEVEGWEKAVNSFIVDFDVDVYLTCSNSHLLSSELATYLAGRYVEIPVFTLSYREFLDFRKQYFNEESTANSFVQYLRFGGFPVIHNANYSEEAAYNIVYDIYSSVILRDTVQQYKIRILNF